MKVLSLFSGVGGFDLGLEAAGMETVFQCEWDKHATKILERHWPDVPRWGDISTLTGRHILDHAPVIDVVAWGSPCQDLSVAGKRAGLKGERSGLFHEGIRIIKEIRELTNGKYPRISIWENVAGALSSGAGADFGQVLYEMDEAGACFSEWRMLDAQYFGVPQRRRRVFVVSVFDPATAERCPDPLLPVSESVRRNPATGRTTRETVARTVEQSSASSGHGMRGFGDYTDDDTASAIKARDWKDATDLITQPFTVTGVAKYEPGIGTLRSYGGDLAGGSETLLVEPFVKAKRAQSATDDETWVEGDINPTINQFDQGDVRATTAIVIREREGKAGGGKGPLYGEEKSHSLIASNDQKLFVAEPILIDGRRVDDVRVYDPPVQTLQERMGTGGNNVPVIGFSHTQGLSAQPSEQAFPTLRREGSGMAVAESTMTVRRLTPLECERLMGWPDNWTAGQSDTHRYKQCGNGVASPVAQWIGQQLINL